MRIIFFCITISLACVDNSVSQTFKFRGVDINNIDSSLEWPVENDTVRYSYNFDYFDIVVKHKDGKTITFICFQPTLMIYDLLLEEVIDIYKSTETLNDDYVSEFLVEHREFLDISIKSKQSRIIKYWNKPEYQNRCFIIWNHEGLAVQFRN